MIPWAVFYHGDKELASFTVSGMAPGEVEATKELLAYEKNIPVSEIRAVYEVRTTKPKPGARRIHTP